MRAPGLMRIYGVYAGIYVYIQSIYGVYAYSM